MRESRGGKNWQLGVLRVSSRLIVIPPRRKIKWIKEKKSQFLARLKVQADGSGGDGSRMDHWPSATPRAAGEFDTAWVWLSFRIEAFNRSRGVFEHVQRHGWWEYGNYIGALASIVILVSVAWTFVAPSTGERPLARAMAVTAVVFFVLSLGEFSAFAPALWLPHSPAFSSLRIPSRFAVAVSRAVGTTAAIGLFEA